MDLNLEQLYNLLFAGKSLKIPFPSDKEANVFKVQLFRYKKSEDVMLLATEMITETQYLSFQVQSCMSEIMPFGVEVTLQLKSREQRKTYQITILSEDEDEQAPD